MEGAKMAITRKLSVDEKGTLKEFPFKEFQIAGRSVFVKELLLEKGKIPVTKLQALETFLSRGTAKDDIEDFPIYAIIVNRLHENAEAYRGRPFGTDYWIR